MHFQVQDLKVLLEKLKKSKNDKKRNRTQVNLINSGLRDLKEEIENMSEQEKRIKNPNGVVDIVEMILEFNRQQHWQGLNILTPSQMLSRLPNSLAHLKAGNNSEKIKTKIKQLLYSFCSSKKLTKPLYKSLVDYLKMERIFMNSENSKTQI